MLFQLNPREEIQLLIYLTALILGIQLGIYVIYRFVRIKNQELPLNKKFSLLGIVLTLFGNILKLFIINEKNNVCIYSHDFSKKVSEVPQKNYEQLFSVGIIGIDVVLSAITNTRGEKINKIKQADSLILLEYSSGIASQIIYALVVKKDLKSSIYFLKSIRNQFESFYRELLKELDSLRGSEEELFKSFDVIIEDVLY